MGLLPKVSHKNLKKHDKLATLLIIDELGKNDQLKLSSV